MRPDGSNECVWQKLSKPFEKGKSYRLHLFLCQDGNYSSKLSLKGELVDFNQPAIVRIRGSNAGLSDVILAESNQIGHPDWREYTFDLKPSRNFSNIVIEVDFANEAEPGAGNVLIDHATLIMIDE